MRVRKTRRRNPDGEVREYWEADLRYRGKGRRRFFERKQDAEAWLGQYGRLHRKRRRAPTDHPTVGEFVKRVAEKRKGACADGTYAILNTQLGYLNAYEVRPGVRLTDLRLEALD